MGQEAVRFDTKGWKEARRRLEGGWYGDYGLREDRKSGKGS